MRIDPLSTNGGMSLTQACEGDFAPAKLKIGKPDRNFALSAQKIQNSSQDFAFSARKLRISCSNFAFSARKMSNSAQDFLFPRRKCQIPRSISLFLRSISDFPCGKYKCRLAEREFVPSAGRGGMTTARTWTKYTNSPRNCDL